MELITSNNIRPRPLLALVWGLEPEGLFLGVQSKCVNDPMLLQEGVF